MKNLTLCAIISLYTCILQAQIKNQVTYDEKAQQNILIGYCDKEGVSSFGEWFSPEFNNYIVDTVTLARINPALLSKTKITILMGTWCIDSHRELPALYKILRHLNFGQSNVTLIAVNKEKKAPEINIEIFNLEHVPTIIFYIDEKEAGRIIESPEESLEKDMLRILSSIEG